MKKHIKNIFAKMLGSVAMVAIVSACSSSDDIENGERVPTEEDIAETLKKVNTEWGASKEAIKQYMDGYQWVESADENVLQFNAKEVAHNHRLPICVRSAMRRSDNDEKGRRGSQHTELAS